MKRSREALQKAGGRTKDGRTLPPASIWIVGADTDHGPDHPLYSDDAVQLARSKNYEPFAAMVRNIRALGIIEPVRVRLVSVAPDDALWPEAARELGEVYVAVTGRHRTLLARRAAAELFQEGLISSMEQWQIDTVLDSSNESAQLDKVISENAFRRRPSAIEIGFQVAQSLDRGFTMDALRERFDYSESQLRNFMTLAQHGVAELHAAVRAGSVPVTEACKIARLPSQEQCTALGAEKGSRRERGPRRPGRRVLEVAEKRILDAPWATLRERELLGVIAGTIDISAASAEVRALFEEQTI
jgi:hypothetical protein